MYVEDVELSLPDSSSLVKVLDDIAVSVDSVADKNEDFVTQPIKRRYRHD